MTTTLRTKTSDLARYWAKTGTDILFSEKDPFDGSVSKEKLENNLYDQIIINIVNFETTDVSEEQLQACIEKSKI